MKSKYIYTKDVNFTPTEKEYNVIKAGLDYIKSKGIALFLREGKLENENGYSSFSFMMVGSKSKIILLENMTRFNQKKFDAFCNDFFEKNKNQDIVNMLIS